MRTWRVGTFSMGASLLLLGIFLLFSRVIGLDLSHVMMSWWPAILVVLGAEILIYLFLSKQEKPFLKYDFLSIFFIGLLGTVGIAFVIFNSTGLLGKVQEVMAREERTSELPGFDYKLDSSVKRVVVRTVDYPLTIEGTSENAVSMFGTYRAQTAKRNKLISKTEDYIYANQKGDTLYLNVKSLPSEMGPFDSYSTIAATILVPKDVTVEIIGNENPITLKPREIMNDWSVNGASSLVVQVGKNSDLKISAAGVQDVQGKDGAWKVTEEKPDAQGNYSGFKNATYQKGEGKHLLSIANTSNVSLNIEE